MNLLDMIVLLVLLLFSLKGLLRGFVNEVASLTGLLMGGWLAYRFYPALSVPLGNSLHVPEHIAAFLSFMLLLMLTGVLAHILGNIITSALRIVLPGGLNGAGGVMVGAAEGILLLSMLFCIGTADYMPIKLKQGIQRTGSARLLAKIGDTLLLTWRGRTGGQQ